MVGYVKCGGGEAGYCCALPVLPAGRLCLFCGYHGWHDWYLAANLSAEANLDAHLFPGIEPIGVPRRWPAPRLPFPYGDLAALGKLLDQHKGKVAAVIMEPLRSEMPPAGYLEGVAKLCQEHDAVLIFDEVTTGFRLHVGGVQAGLGVTPDMAVFAKAISNGYPMAAVVGKRAVMEPAGRMFISSTYWSDTIGLRAALTTHSGTAQARRAGLTSAPAAELQRRLNAVAAEVGLAVRCGGLTDPSGAAVSVPTIRH